jgi:hypothetical protein
MTTSRSLNVQTLLAATLLALGILLVAFMVTTEGEPGALPLALVLAGAGWLAAARWRARKRSG